MDQVSILRDVMSRTGTTQSQLSVLSGVKQPSLSQMLHSRIHLSDAMLERLLSCMGYHLEVVRRARPMDLDHSSERRWRLHQRLVLQLSAESLREWGPQIMRNLEQLKKTTRGEPHLRNLDRWSDLISSEDLLAIRRFMTGLDTDSVQMREVSPFGGLLLEHERQRTLMDGRR